MQTQDQTRSAPPVGSTGRWPATAVFFLNGLTLSTHIVRLPSLKDEYQLSDGRLGVIGVLFGLAALASMQFVGPLVARVGSSAVGQADAGSPDAAVLISRFTTFTYAGILLGPAAIGWTAELAGLTWTLSTLIPVLVIVAVLSRLPGPRP